MIINGKLVTFATIAIGGNPLPMSDGPIIVNYKTRAYPGAHLRGYKGDGEEYTFLGFIVEEDGTRTALVRDSSGKQIELRGVVVNAVEQLELGEFRMSIPFEELVRRLK